MPPSDSTALLRVRWAAACLAVLLCLGVGLALLVIAALQPVSDGGLRVWLLNVAFASAVGAIVGPWIAWDSAATVVTTDGSLRPLVVRLAAHAVVAGALLVSFSWVVASIPQAWSSSADFTMSTLGDAVIAPLVAGVASFAFLVSWGLLIFGLPAVALAIAFVAVWAHLVRWLGRRSTAIDR